MLGLITPIAASAVLFVAQTTRPSSVTEPTTSSGFWAVVCTAVIGYAWQAFRDWRDRKWRMADDARTAEIARLAKENQDLVARLAAETKRELGSAVAENTDLTKQVVEIGKQGVDLNKEAIKVGNNFNNKFAAVMEKSNVDFTQGVQNVAAAVESVATAVQQLPPQ